MPSQPGAGTNAVSVFTVHEVCYRAAHDPPFRDAVLADPVYALEPLDLTTVEREALLQGNVGCLYLLGAHTYLLGHLVRYKLFGLDRDRYATSMWAAARSAGHPTGGP